MSLRGGPLVAKSGNAPLGPDQIKRLARQRLCRSAPEAFYFKDVSFQLRDRTLILSGRVPTAYMAQLLESLLSSLEGVSKVDNRVAIVSATGLSSIRPK